MEGGIRAWKGLVAEGVPDSGMAYFSSATKPVEMIALAWVLEGGSRSFYSQLAQGLEDSEARRLFGELATAEERHQSALVKLYTESSGSSPGPAFPEPVLASVDEDVMEGGMRVSEALAWSKGKSVTEILDLSLGLETYAYDVYLVMGRRLKDRRSAEVFQVLSGEEKQHLERLSSLLERKI